MLLHKVNLQEELLSERKKHQLQIQRSKRQRLKNLKRMIGH